jgi:hypothetical protein
MITKAMRIAVVSPVWFAVPQTDSSTPATR